MSIIFLRRSALKLVRLILFFITIIIGLSITGRFLRSNSVDMASNDDPNDIFKFFPDCQNDGLNLRWAHAVNSWSQLNETLFSTNSIRFHMIESDVIVRQNRSASNEENVPVMAHPPATDSDLNFEDWLTTINTFRGPNRVGAKADFKSLDAVKASLRIVQRHRNSLTVPLWLNADIVRGPGDGGSAAPIDAKEFLRTCTDYGAGMTLSIGWTTPSNVVEYRRQGGYGWPEILNMFNLLLPFLREMAAGDGLPRITFAVRAVLVRPSYQRLAWLLEACAMAVGGEQYRDNFSVTLWTSITADQLTQNDYRAIAHFRHSSGKNRVFVDLPDADVSFLNPDLSLYTDLKAFDPNLWEFIDIDPGKILKSERMGVTFLGSSSARLKANLLPNDTVLYCRFVINSSTDSDQSNGSVFISVTNGIDDEALWTLEISAGPCSNVKERAHYDCINILHRQATYSVSISIRGPYIRGDWMRMREHVIVDDPLNGTREESTATFFERGNFAKDLNDNLETGKIFIEKIGSCDFIFDMLLLY